MLVWILIYTYVLDIIINRNEDSYWLELLYTHSKICVGIGVDELEKNNN